MLGFIKRRKNKDKAASSKKRKKTQVPADELVKVRNDEITIRLDSVGDVFVETAIASHIGTREYQQDAAYVCDTVLNTNEKRIAFGVLCDGMGGMDKGDQVSSETVSFVANRINDYKADEDWPEFLEQAAFDANQLAYETNTEEGIESGTTLVAAVIDDNRLFWLSVGDSRIYIIRKDEIVLATRDHNLGLELLKQVDAGVLSLEEADKDPRKDMLISYIGAEKLEIADVNQSAVSLERNDLILLCSDGLTKVFEEDEILSIITSHCGSLQTLAADLTLATFNKSPLSMDNTTVILMQYFGDVQ